MSDLTIGHLVLLFVFVIISTFVVRIAIKFDLNEYLKRKDEKLKRKIQITCPHIIIKKSENGNFVIEDGFQSPIGTITWICRRCSFIKYTHNESDFIEIKNYYEKNIKEYLKSNEKTNKLIQKL